ncbi:MAG: rhamnulokinase [Dysgonamonadaceae bacterium]|nr:rhamnulokinase [Dysgonamonadaceae bacterium]
MSTSFLAIDLGATSGRAILGTIHNDCLKLEEINRFPNPIIEIKNRLYWDLFHLYNEILLSLKKVNTMGVDIKSIGIDTWGVDFVCFGKDGEPLRMPYSYRDSHTVNAPEKFFKIIPKETVYKRTGIQIMNFNSLFQFATQKEENSEIFDLTDKILFMPDALSYLLTGEMVTEYTIASTSQAIDPYEKKFDATLLKTVGLTEKHFAPIVFSGTQIGTLTGSVQCISGLGKVPVIAVAGHDTASAVLATPAENSHFAYLSSGTWSLLGVESNKPVINDETYKLNYTNEGGADGSIRLLKNICGMWLIERCRVEWEKDRPITYGEIVYDAEVSEPFRSFINPDSPCFASPESMTNAIQDYCRKTNQPVPETIGQFARCIYESLAFRYCQALENLQKLTDFPIEVLHIIGGGSQNKLLNAYTANAIGKRVIAGPSEATAMGNILVQAQTYGLVKDKQGMRNIVRNSVDLSTFEPQDPEVWRAHYADYLKAFANI